MNALLLLSLVAAADLVKEQQVAAPPDKVFEAWSTTEGVKTFFAPNANVEPKVGGKYELYFIPAAPEGARGSEGATVKALEPGKKLSFSWNFPPSFPALRNAKEQTLVTVELSAEGKATKVRLTHSGFKDGGDWDKAREYFDGAWKHVLARLERRFAKGPMKFDKGYWPADAAAFRFLDGRWHGVKGHQTIDESWTWSPQGLVGSYRELENDKPVFYELGTIGSDGNDWFLTLRMFEPGLRDHPRFKGPQRFRFEAAMNDDAWFVSEGKDGVTLHYAKVGEHLEVTVDRGAKGKETFTYERVK